MVLPTPRASGDVVLHRPPDDEVLPAHPARHRLRTRCGRPCPHASHDSWPPPELLTGNFMSQHAPGSAGLILDRDGANSWAGWGTRSGCLPLGWAGELSEPHARWSTRLPEQTSTTLAHGREASSMARAVGIDLGTTNSVVTVLEGGEPTVIANSEGSRTTPSVVAFAKNGEVLVGQSAKNQAVTNVDRTIRSVKRHMGTDWKTNEIDGKRYTPQEISARILQKLKRDAEPYLGEPVTDAVITVPAYFEDAQRQATKEAGDIAGLNVLRIVNEPTAAALAYGLDKGETEQTILVFDLGGGTFDVSLLEIGDGVIEVKATAGDNHLGGDDWDERIVTHLVKTFNASNGIDLSKDKLAMQRLRESAEKAKIELSSSSETTVNLPYITASNEGPLHLEVKISRSEFQKMTSDLLERCKGPFQ